MTGSATDNSPPEKPDGGRRLRQASRAVTGQPLHGKALGLYMFHTFTMGVATISGLQLAIPTIMEDFNAPVTTVVWISIAYFVALVGATMALGDVTTYFDRRALVVLGIAVDILLMLVIFFTHNIYVFIVCRFLSATFRIFPWLILQVIGIGGFPPEQRGKAIGYNTLVTGLGFMLALPLTGFFLDHFGWRWLFMACSLVYVALIPVVFLLLPKLPPDVEKRKPLSEFDVLGSVLMVTGAISLLTSLQLFARGLSSTTLPVVLALLGVSSLAGFIWVELHAKSPILKFSIFRIRNVTLAASQAVIMGFTNGAFSLMLPFMFIAGVGWSAGHTSNVLFFQNVTRPPSGPLAGRLSDKFGSAAVILPAAVISVAGQVGLVLLNASPAAHVVVGVLLFWGTGQALMQTANLRQIYAALPASQLHLAPSVNLTMQTLGSATGVAFASLAVERAQDLGGGVPFLGRIDDAMLAVTAFFIVGIILTQTLPRLLLRPQAELAEEPETVDRSGD